MATPDSVLGPESPEQRRRRLARELEEREDRLRKLEQPAVRKLLEREAESAARGDPDALVDADVLATLDELLHRARVARAGTRGRLELFFSSDDVLLLPGFLGSSLSDEGQRNHGLIWIDPKLVFSPGQLSALRLASYREPEVDASPDIEIKARGALPLIYDLMALNLELRRYSVTIYPIDWRKNLEESAQLLARMILLHDTSRPLHVVAHSQGSLVARRAIQLLGGDEAFARVRNLVLLGPATRGTFSSAFALSGQHESIDDLRRYGIRPPEDFPFVLQSMTGLYQLLPWDRDRLPWLGEEAFDLSRPEFWQTGVDTERLGIFFGWSRQIDTAFFNERTTMILGDNYGNGTVGGVVFRGNQMTASDDHYLPGDGTVPHRCAALPGVTTYLARNTEHMKLTMRSSCVSAVAAILAGRRPALPETEIVDRGPAPAVAFAAEATRPVPGAFSATRIGAGGAPARPLAPELIPGPVPIEVPPPPPFRPLRVFSFDPLLGTQIDTLSINVATLPVPWEPDLTPGPVGEYFEVIDHDPASDAFYPPVDLNHPHVLSQDGLEPSEGTPQFHQQMVYAVGMTAVEAFERALGRAALWSPRLIREGGSIKEEYIGRLRIHPHGLRQANAYYDPEKKALLFGYFPARPDGGLNLPGGTVFTCLSHDIVAHETTHALLDGLHRYFIEPTNPDVLAFHEAFADIVALFLHFSQAEVLRHQIARTRGDLGRQSLLGELAQQFGQAIGKRGALRSAIGRVNPQTRQWEPLPPDPSAYQKVTEPHDRGAILVAAVFDGFLTIYKSRIADLLRIATQGSGILPEGAIHPDLVNRLAGEAARSAKHVLQMCVRALDYVPPVDVTFGEYLRAVITGDVDLVADDDRHYRVAMIDAFRRRGLYPRGVRSLSVESLCWESPTLELPPAGELVQRLNLGDWQRTTDRFEIHERMRHAQRELHQWLVALPHADGLSQSVGLSLGPKTPLSIARDRAGVPVFEVHSVRPCRRIGPDGQTLTEIVAVLMQRRRGYFEADRQKTADRGGLANQQPDFWFRGGCTVLIDTRSARVRFCIAKDVLSATRMERQREFINSPAGASLRATYFGDASHLGGGVFARLHGEE